MYRRGFAGLIVLGYMSSGIFPASKRPARRATYLSPIAKPRAMYELRKTTDAMPILRQYLAVEHAPPLNYPGSWVSRATV
jgi:hypothetical protein